MGGNGVASNLLSIHSTTITSKQFFEKALCSLVPGLFNNGCCQQVKLDYLLLLQLAYKVVAAEAKACFFLNVIFC